MSDRASIPVKVGSVSLLVSPHAKGFRFGWKDDNGEWRYTTKKNRKDAIDAARDKAREISNGAADLQLTPDEAALWKRVKRLKLTHSDLDAWEKRNRIVSPPLREVVQAMIADKSTARGGKGIHLNILERDLRALPQDKPIDEVTADDVISWLQGYRERGVGQRRLRNLRASAVTLFRWARKREYVPDETTAPEKTEEIGSGRGKGRSRKVEVYTEAELRTLLETAPDDWRGFVLLGAFAGIRSDELFPERRLGKEGLLWSEVDRAHGVIRVPAHVSKTGHPRIVPIRPNLEAWLKLIEAPKDGPIIAGDHEASRRRRKNAVGALWKRNGLRHSYGTYRVAQTQDMPKVALEMGNSVGMIRLHYFEAVTQAKGEEWFAILPPVGQGRQNLSEPPASDA